MNNTATTKQQTGKPIRFVYNQRGQMILEYILLTVIVVGVSLVVASSFKSNEILAKLASGPWDNMASMIQNGAWGNPKNTMRLHPNNHSSSNSLAEDKVR